MTIVLDFLLSFILLAAGFAIALLLWLCAWLEDWQCVSSFANGTGLGFMTILRVLACFTDYIWILNCNVTTKTFRVNGKLKSNFQCTYALVSSKFRLGSCTHGRLLWDLNSNTVRKVWKNLQNRHKIQTGSICKGTYASSVFYSSASTQTSKNPDRSHLQMKLSHSQFCTHAHCHKHIALGSIVGHYNYPGVSK